MLAKYYSLSRNWDEYCICKKKGTTYCVNTPYTCLSKPQSDSGILIT